MEKNFTNYDSVDFAQESSFIRWVKQRDSASAKFWEGWISAHPDKKKLIEEARRMVLSIRFKEEEIKQERVDKLWNKIDEATQQTTDNRQPNSAKVVSIKPLAKRRVLLRTIASAAAVIILLVSFWFLYDPATTVKAGTGQQLAHQLPDASKIELNAGSTIEYKKGEWANDRTIRLEGEAFFEVEKGSKFTVITPSGNVEVLGTSFNVYARDGELSVDCFTGKVRVSHEAQEVILTKGLGTSLEGSLSVGADQKLKPAATIELKEAASWRGGEFSFDNLRMLFSELERQYGVRIKASAEVLSRTGSYNFSKKETLETALDQLSKVSNIKYQREGKVITISE